MPIRPALRSFLPSFTQPICQTFLLPDTLGLESQSPSPAAHWPRCSPLVRLTSDVVPCSLLAPLPWENPPSLPGSPKSTSLAWTSPPNLKLVRLPAHLVFVPLGCPGVDCQSHCHPCGPLNLLRSSGGSDPKSGGHPDSSLSLTPTANPSAILGGSIFGIELEAGHGSRPHGPRRVQAALLACLRYCSPSKRESLPPPLPPHRGLVAASPTPVSSLLLLRTPVLN